MSEAKMCDRCKNFFTLPVNGMSMIRDGSFPIFISSHRLRSNHDKLVSFEAETPNVKTRTGKIMFGDLCPKCSQSLLHWWDSGMDKVQDG